MVFVNVLYVCFDLCVVYGAGRCLHVCGVVCIVECCLFQESVCFLWCCHVV